MLLIEIIIPERNERYFTNVNSDMTVMELARSIGELFKLNLPSILFLGMNGYSSMDLSLKDLGIKNGTGVLVSDGGI